MIANASATLAHTSEPSIMSYVSPIMICYGQNIALLGLGLVLVYVQRIVFRDHHPKGIRFLDQVKSLTLTIKGYAPVPVRSWQM
jgi:hypothetical protein